MPLFCGCRPFLCPGKNAPEPHRPAHVFSRKERNKSLDLSLLQFPAVSLIQQKETAGAAPVSAASVSLTLSLYHTFLTPRKFSSDRLSLFPELSRVLPPGYFLLLQSSFFLSALFIL